jgi:hypothetical protein
MSYWLQWIKCRVGWHYWITFRVSNGDPWTRCALCARRP